MYFFTRCCRLCCDQSPGLLYFDSKDKDGVMLSSKMNLVFPYSDDGYPKWMCVTCYRDLNQAYDFRRFCAESYQNLEKQRAVLNPRNDENNRNSQEIRVYVRDCVTDPSPENCRYFDHLKYQTSLARNNEILSACETPKGKTLKRKRFLEEAQMINKRRKIRFSDPLSNILTEKKSPIHDAVPKPIIKPSPTSSVVNGRRLQPQKPVKDIVNNANRFADSPEFDVNNDEGFLGFDMGSEDVCVQKAKFKINFFEYITSHCTTKKDDCANNINGVIRDSGMSLKDLFQQNGALNTKLFSNNNQLFKTFYKGLESSLVDENNSTPCRLCSKFYRDFKVFLDLQKTEVITIPDN